MSPGQTHALGDCGSTGQPNDHKGFGPSNAPLRPRTTPLFPPVLGDDAVEVLGLCRPAFDPPWMLVTVLVAQHRGLAGRVGARGISQYGGGPLAMRFFAMDEWQIMTMV